MPRAVLAIASIALSVYALTDCIGTEDSRVRGIPRWAWIALIVLVPWVGPITWLLAGKTMRSFSGPGQGARSARRPAGPTSPAPTSRRRSLAPDDDPEFLRALGEQIRRERRERERGRDADGGASGHDDDGTLPRER